MYTLIDDLLTLAREGNEASEMEPVDLGDLVDQCWQNIPTGEATIHSEFRGVINADRTRLQQLIENLFKNALEHGGEDVTVTLGMLDDGFYVEDDGFGIDPETREDIFDADFSTSGGGTGLGLVIVRQVAQAHGWQVEVHRGDDGGARFEITGVEFVE